jgi:hypothetical protein
LGRLPCLAYARQHMPGIRKPPRKIRHLADVMPPLSDSLLITDGNSYGKPSQEARRLIYEDNRHTDQAHARTQKHQEVRQQKGSN